MQTKIPLSPLQLHQLLVFRTHQISHHPETLHIVSSAWNTLPRVLRVSAQISSLTYIQSRNSDPQESLSLSLFALSFYHQRLTDTLHVNLFAKRVYPGSDGKESACNAGHLGSIAGSENPLEKGLATHSSILAWRIPWTKEPGGLRSMG